MKKDDLISRAEAIDEVMQMVERHRHEIFRGELLHYTGIKAALECLPAIDAIPVEWLKQIQTECVCDTVQAPMYVAIGWLIDMWQKEQEAR